MGICVDHGNYNSRHVKPDISKMIPCQWSDPLTPQILLILLLRECLTRLPSIQKETGPLSSQGRSTAAPRRSHLAFVR